MPVVMNILLVILVTLGGLIDMRTRRLPNWLALLGVCFGCVLNSFLFGFPGFQLSVSGAALGFGVYLAFYLIRAMGAGDVKFMAAVGAIVGPKVWLLIFFFTALCGGVVALVLLLTNGRLTKTLKNLGMMLYQLSRFQAPYHANDELDVRSEKALRLPHGAIIALGTIAYLYLDFHYRRSP